MSAKEYLYKKYGSKKEEIGKGTSAVVYKYQNDDRLVAVKKLTSYTSQQISAIREMVCHMKVNDHPNIVKLLEVIYYLKGDSLFLVLELGISNLKDFSDNYRKERSQLENQEKEQDQEFKIIFKSLLYDVSLALAYLRTENIMHRDLKPHNILIFKSHNQGQNKYTAKLADFGIARGKICQNDDYSMTNPVYSLWYRPIEVLLEGNYSFPAEIWALACLFYEVMENDILFRGYNQFDMLNTIFIIRGDIKKEWPQSANFPIKIPSLSFNGKWSDFVKNKNLSPNFAHLLDQMLIYNPHNRINIYQILRDPYFDREFQERKGKFESLKESPKLKKSQNLEESSQFDLETYRRLHPSNYRSCIEILDQNDYYNQLTLPSRIELEKRITDINQLIPLINKGKGLIRISTLILAIYIYDVYYQERKEQKEHFEQLRNNSNFYLLILNIAQRFIDRYNIDFPNYQSHLDHEADILYAMGFQLDVSLIPDYLNLYLKYYPSLKEQKLYHKAFKIYAGELPFKYSAKLLTLALIKYYCDKLNIPWKHQNDIFDITSQLTIKEQLAQFEIIYNRIATIVETEKLIIEA